MELEEKNRKQKKATSTDDRVLYANAIVVVVEKRPQKRPLLLLSLRLNVVLPFFGRGFLFLLCYFVLRYFRRHFPNF